MKYIKTLIKCLLKNKLVSLFLLIQFSITFFVILFAMDNRLVISEKKEQISKYLDLDKTVVLRHNQVENNYSDKYIKYKKELLENRGVRGIGYYAYYDNPYVRDNEEYDDKSQNQIRQIDNKLYMNYDMFKLTTIKVEEGRSLSKDDFEDAEEFNKNSNIVPVLIGSELKKVFRVGEIIKSINTYGSYTKFKIVGVIKANQTFLDTGFNYIYTAPKSLNKSIIAPIWNDAILDNAAYVSFVSTDSKEVAEKVKLMALKNADKYSIDLQCTLVKEDLDSYIENYMKYFKMFFNISISLVFFSLFGTIMTMTLSLNKRKKEFGIRLACGNKKWYLCFLIIGENFIIITFAYFIALLMKANFGSETGISLGKSTLQVFGLMFSIKFLLTTLFVLSVFSISVVVDIYKMQPVDVIKGR